METTIDNEKKSENIVDVTTEKNVFNIQMKYSNNDIYDLEIDRNATIMDIVKKAYLNKNKSILSGVEYDHIPDKIIYKLKIVYRGKLLKIDSSRVVEILSVDSDDIFHCVFTKPTDEDITNIKNNMATSDELINSLVTSECFLSFIRVPFNYKKILKIIKHGFGGHKNTKDKSKNDEIIEVNETKKTEVNKPVKKVVKSSKKNIYVEDTEMQIEKLLDESETDYETESDEEVGRVVPVKKTTKMSTRSNNIDVESTYTGVINELNSMGFSFNDNIKNLLIRHQGDIQLVLNTLLG